MRTTIPAAFVRELAGIHLPTSPPDDTPLVTEADLAGLPASVRRYFAFMRVVGRPRAWSFRMGLTGRFRRSLEEAWMPCEAWQYNTRVAIARVFRIRIHVGGIVPLVGHDTYVDGHGRMLIKLLDLFPVGDDSGEKLDIGELVTWLNDAVLMAPVMLLDERVQFTGVDDRTFDVSVTDAGRTVTGRVTLDDEGAPLDFETTDRFVQGPDGTWGRARWHTPIDAWIRVADGRAFPTTGRAAWMLPAGEFTYIELNFWPDTFRFDVLPGE
jgi:hypothetical protein